MNCRFTPIDARSVRVLTLWTLRMALHHRPGEGSGEPS